jgi:hypothetical protein
MSTTTPRRRAAVLLATTLIALQLASAAASAATAAANFRITPARYSTGAEVGTCRGWGADADSAGNLYMACPVMRDLDGNGTGDVLAPALYELDPAGVVQRIGWLPPEYAFNTTYPIRDVGVSPDGKVAYVSVGPNTDNLGLRPELNPTTKQVMANGATQGSILRLRRQADGSWTHDPTFKAGPFQIAGGNYWAARYVDVDASGRIYVTVNSYVYELSPTTGAVVSAFGGGQTAYPGGPWVEGIDTPEGLAVSADGGSIYVVEQQHHLVQRWTRVGATDWTRDRGFLLGVPSQEGDHLCASNAHLQSPYDVSVDGAGDVYVLDTSCQRIQRFTSTGAYVQTVWSNIGGDELSHGMAVNWQGSVLLPIEEDLLVRLDPPARPTAPAAPGCVDRSAPKVTRVTASARSTTRRLAVAVEASDDCAVTHVRVTGDRVGTGAWIAGTELVVPLGGWNGRKVLVAQVRDRAGRVSARRFAVTLALPQAPLRARTRVDLAGRGCSTVDPRRRIGSYRLVDRCARISGRIVTVVRRGASTSVQLLLPTAQARALYTNAVGPVRIWAVTDSRSRASGRLRRGGAVTIDGSLVVERDGSIVHAIPVDRMVGR